MIVRAIWLLLSIGLSALEGKGAEASFKEELERRALQYFIENLHPISGLVRDRAANQGLMQEWGSKYRVASLAATGFGLAALSSAVERGQLDAKLTQDRIIKTLRFCRDRLFHRRGWFYHFVDWETGVRWKESEISTVDTAWFLAGALYAGEIFGGEIANLAHSLYERVDFYDMMTDGGALPTKRTISMGWIPEFGYLPWQWDSYSEHMILVILGLGHPKTPLPRETWTAWNRPKSSSVEGGLVLSPDQGLFIHQYSHVFLDFRHLKDGIADYFKSSLHATLRDKKLCAENPQYLTYQSGFWGLSASGSPTGYKPFSPVFHDGTVCPSCAGASVIFAKEMVLNDLQSWARGPYSDRVWGNYGFVDSVNIGAKWYDPDVLGITLGALYLALIDLDPNFAIWRRFENISVVNCGLWRAKLTSQSFSPDCK